MPLGIFHLKLTENHLSVLYWLKVMSEDVDVSLLLGCGSVQGSSGIPCGSIRRSYTWHLSLWPPLKSSKLAGWR